jgi:hypothetical protein
VSEQALRGHRESGRQSKQGSPLAVKAQEEEVDERVEVGRQEEVSPGQLGPGKVPGRELLVALLGPERRRDSKDEVERRRMDRALLEGPIGPAAVECRPVNDGVDWTARWISRRTLQHRKGARRAEGQRTILDFDAAQRMQMSVGQAAVRASAAGQSLQRMRYQWRRLSTMCRSSRSTGAFYSVSIVSCQLSLGHRQSSSEEDPPPSQPAPPPAWLLSQRSVSAKPWRGQR